MVRVSIGLISANKETPLIILVEWKVSLPDHNWDVAARHKLIPSVYAVIDTERKKKRTWPSKLLDNQVLLM